MPAKFNEACILSILAKVQKHREWFFLIFRDGFTKANPNISESRLEQVLNRNTDKSPEFLLESFINLVISACGNPVLPDLPSTDPQARDHEEGIERAENLDMPERCLFCFRLLAKADPTRRFPYACDRPECQEDSRRAVLKITRRQLASGEPPPEPKKKKIGFRKPGKNASQ